MAASLLNWMRAVLLHVTFVQKYVLMTLLHSMNGIRPTMDMIGTVDVIFAEMDVIFVQKNVLRTACIQ